ncbi:MAG: dihydrolipoyllysine-residue acetyltransferase [Myxococcota bacterium]
MADLIEVKVPDIGDFSEVEIVEVLVSPGDQVDVESPLITLESDKASMEVPSTAAGVVKEVLVKVGGTVSEGDVVVRLEASAGAPSQEAPAAPPAAAPAPPAAEEPPPAGATDEPSPGEIQTAQRAQHSVPAAGSPDAPIDEEGFAKAHASPSVRRFARELGANLGKIHGTGRKGRILRDDVVEYVKTALKRSEARDAGQATGGAGIPPIPEIDFSKFGDIETVALSRIKKISGPVLLRSWLNVPHVTHNDLADITETDAFRKEVDTQAKQEGYRVTLLSFIMKAVTKALAEMPEFNASLSSDGQSLILKKYFHIGVAVDTPNGLVVPVVRDVDKKGIIEVSKELGALSKKARDGKLGPKDLQGGCFSISSLGGIGGTSFTPIVNAPEVAILGVTRSRMTPVWNGSDFKPRLMLPLSLSYDHRVIDGAAAARFVVRLGQLLSDARRILL